MTFTSTILPPIHLLLYSTLLGTQLYQSFIVTKITHRALPISSFTSLQKKLFPTYFRTTALLALGTIVTWPHWTTGEAFRGRMAWKEGKGWEVGLLGVIVAMAGVNWAWLGEAVRGVMVERIHQETRDGKKYTELEAQSETMRGLNRRFRKLHAASIHVNLIGLGATVTYGVILGNKLG